MEKWAGFAQRLDGFKFEVTDSGHSVAQTSSELKGLIQAIDNNVIFSIADGDGKITYANKKLCEISGYSSDELIGQDHRIFKSEEHTPALYQALWSSIANGKTWQGEIKNLKKGGKEFYWIMQTIVPILGEDGVPEQYFSVQVDLSKIKETQRLLQTAKEEAEKASEAKDNFLATFSHELRTPLTAIIGTNSLLSSDEIDPEKQALHNVIDQSGKNQLNLVNDILDMTKIHAGLLTIDHNREFDLSLLLSELQQEFALLAKEKNLSFEVLLNYDEANKLFGDSKRIKQVLSNLLKNAIKFSYSGSVTLSCNREGGALLFQVKDSGIGLSEEEQANLFKIFEQADGKLNREFGGVGLGLYLSRHLSQPGLFTK